MVLKQLKYVKTQPDLVLMDIQMPILDGLKAGKIVQDQLASSIVFYLHTVTYKIRTRLKIRRTGLFS